MNPVFFIEFLDELIFGLREAAWPQIRSDFELTYSQVGILLGVPSIVSSIIEPFLGILSDRGQRHKLIIVGGILFSGSLLLSGISHSFVLLLISFVLFYPSSGAFVSLSQTELMDQEPAKREKNMAKWSFTGSLGVVLGPLLLAGTLFLGGSWRTPFFLFSVMAIIVVGFKWHKPTSVKQSGNSLSFTEDVREVFRMLFNVKVLRWLTLLSMSDLMLDVLLGYLTLYFVDVVSSTQIQASFAVLAWAVVGLVGDFLLIPLLDKITGLAYLRHSAAIELVLFPIFLIMPGYFSKIFLLGCLGLFNAGWYSILKSQLYNTLPDKSGVVLALGNIFGLFGAIIPWCIGLAADHFGLNFAMWLLLLGPMSVLLGLPRKNSRRLNWSRRENHIK